MSTLSPSPHRWLGLTLIAAAQFVVIMDTSIIGVALPGIQRDLGFTPESLSWVFNAYVIAFGGLLLLGGRLADILGARKIFALGWATLIAGSAIAGAATNVGVEIGGRALQGAGAALIAPAALALLMTMFGNTAELPRAFAVYGAAAPIGGTAGVFLGGVLTEIASWPWVYYITIPIAALVLALTAKVLPRTPKRSAGSIDVGGALTATGGLAALVYAVVRAPEEGWLSGTTLLVLGVGIGLLITFFVIQSRSRVPLLRLGLLRSRPIAAANTAQLLLGAAWVSMWFFLNLYIQQVLGAGAFLAGAALLPMTGLIVAGMVVLAPRLQRRLSTRTMVSSGLALLGAALVWLSLSRPDGSYIVDVVPASLLAALGMSLAFVPSLGTAISAAPPVEAGVASGLVSTSYQIGSAIGLAGFTALAIAVTGTGTDLAALTRGYSAAFLGAGVLALVAAVVSAIALRDPRGSQEPLSEEQPARLG